MAPPSMQKCLIPNSTRSKVCAHICTHFDKCKHSQPKPGSILSFRGVRATIFNDEMQGRTGIWGYQGFPQEVVGLALRKKKINKKERGKKVYHLCQTCCGLHGELGWFAINVTIPVFTYHCLC